MAKSSSKKSSSKKGSSKKGSSKKGSSKKGSSKKGSTRPGNLKRIQENVNTIITIVSNTLNIDGQILPPLNLGGFDLPICAAILSVTYEIKLEKNELSITHLEKPLRANLFKIGQLRQNGGGSGELVRQKSTLALSKRSLKHLLWLLFSLFTVYITTTFLSYTYLDSLRLQDRLAKVKYNQLKDELERGINSPKLTSLMKLTELYLQYDELETNDDFLSAQKKVLIQYIDNATKINGKLLLPPPPPFSIDNTSKSSGDQLLDIDQIPSIWSSVSILSKGTDSYVKSLLAPYKNEIQDWTELAERQTEQINELQELGNELVKKMKKDRLILEKKTSSSTEVMGAVNDIFSNMFDYMVGTTKVSQVSKIEGKLKVAHEIFRILPTVGSDLLFRVPNVPHQVGEIYGHYKNVLDLIIGAYAFSGFVLSILFTVFGWLINKLIKDETMSDEEKQQVLEDAVDKFSHMSMGDIVKHGLGKKLTPVQVKEVANHLITNIIPKSQQNTAEKELYQLLKEPIIQEGSKKLKTIKSSRGKNRSQIIEEFLSTIMGEINSKSTTMAVSNKRRTITNKGGKKPKRKTRKRVY